MKRKKILGSQPTVKDVHIDAPLSNFSIATFNEPSSFIALQSFPAIPVKHESDKYYVYPASHLFRSTVEARGETAPVKHRGYALSNGNYTANEYCTGILVPDRVANNSDLPLRPYEDATDIITHDMLMFIERNWATEFMTTSVWTTDRTLSGADRWNQFSTSDPLGDITLAIETIEGLTGQPAENLRIAMGGQVWNVLKRHPQLLSHFGGGDPKLKILTKDIVADIFGVKEILVGRALINLNLEGNATQTLSRIIGKSCLVFYRPEKAAIMKPSAGYFFQKVISQIDRYDVRKRRSQAVEITSTFDFKQTQPDAGYFLNTVID